MTAWMLVRGAIGLVAAALLTVFTTLALLSSSRPLAWTLPAGQPPTVRSVTQPAQQKQRTPEPNPVVQPGPPAPVPTPSDPPSLPVAKPTPSPPASPPPTQKADRTPPKAEQKSPPPASAERPKAASKSPKKASEVARLVEQLSKGNRQDRLEAAKQLGAIGPDAEAAVPVLCLAMASSDPALQLTASESLEQIDPPMRQTMVRLLIDPSFIADLELRKFLTLGETAKQYIPLFLTPIVQSRCSPSVIVDVVAQIDRESPTNVQRVINWATRSDDLAVRSKAVSHLPSMKGMDEKRAAAAMLFLRDSFANYSNHYSDCLLALRVVEELGPLCKAAAPFLRQLKLHEFQEFRRAAERALGAVDSPASPPQGKR